MIISLLAMLSGYCLQRLLSAGAIVFRAKLENFSMDFQIARSLLLLSERNSVLQYVPACNTAVDSNNSRG